MKTSSPDLKKILVVTGEASGDQLGAALIVALRKIRPQTEIHGVGGPKMEALGLKSFLSSGTAHVTGFTEVLRHLPAYLRLFKRIVADVKTIRPNLIVLVDNPGFNLRLAQKLVPTGIPVIGYVSPQVWAWHESRTRTMARVYKKVLTLFDFEEPFLESRGVRAKWVGHPIAEVWPSAPARPREPVRRIVLLPGSRPHEVRSLLPIMVETAARIRRSHPEIVWSLLEADTLPPAFYDPLVASFGNIDRVRTGKQELFWKSDLAFACSGTVTLECALAALPAIIGYRVSALTAFIVRRLTKIRLLGMPNHLAKKILMPEFIQEKFTADNLEQTALAFIQNPSLLDSTRTDLTSLRSHLTAAPSTSILAAQEVLALL